MRKQVVIGFIGVQLDSGRGSGRWERWRPSVALGQHQDFQLDRLDLLYSGEHLPLIEQVGRDLERVSPGTEVCAHDLPIDDPWDFEQVYAGLYDFCKSYPFDTEQEDYWIHITTGTHVAQICLFLLTEARYIPGKLLQTAPPKRQKEGDAGSYNVIDLDLSRYDQLAQRFQHEHVQGADFLKSGIATRNAAFNHMIAEIENVAIKSRAPMLFMGPTGAGKSFLAKRVFALKKARHQLAGRFIEINCATLHGDGAASTLFGHIKGAYTGAAQMRSGLLRSADQGLLFLDEIGELGLDEQAMLLKAIEEKRFHPVGADEEVHSDFQLIAGTNRDLGAEVVAGRFREDLYARINLWTYILPGLAQRNEDIEPNLDYLLSQFGVENGQVVRFLQDARLAYLQFARSTEALWSGNFRDLAASVQRMATLADAGRINLPLVQLEIARLRQQWRHGQPEIAGREELRLEEYLSAEALAGLDLFDAVQLRAVLAVCRQARSLSDAGRLLFAASRSLKAKPNDADRLKKYLAKFGLEWGQINPGAEHIQL